MTTLPTAAPPAWLDTAEYPFQAHYFATDAGRLHYLDEGQGEVLLFVHGTPTWSFLYRAQIRALAARYRCLAVDNLGFGLSDHPAGFDQHPARHAAHLQQLLDYLQVPAYTLIAHDFGGPIALAAALARPGRLRRVVLLNTWLWATAPAPNARRVERLLRSWLGRWLYRHYLRPFPTPGSREALLRLGQWLVGASAWYEEQAARLPALADKPVLLVWGTRDAYLGPALARWQLLLPGARTVALPVGHFPPEEAPAAFTAALQSFLQSSQRVRFPAGLMGK